MTDSRIPPEQLAALLDGTLSREERAKLLVELAGSPEDVALLLESAAIAGEETTSEVVSLVPRRPWRWWGLAVAATVATVVAVSLLRAPAEPEVLALVTQLDGRTPPGEDWAAAPWTGTRGFEDGGVDPVLAFRVGVRLVDLETAARGGQPEVAARMADELSRLLGATAGGTPFAARYALLGEVAPEGERRALAAEVSRLWGESPWLDAGAWLRAAQLATILEDETFFAENSTAKRRLDALVPAIEGAQAGGDATFATGLRAVADLLSRPGTPDWGELGGRLSRLLNEGPP
ncbi:MAG: hypothetical protein ABR551_02825 [Gemmatimonadales bacterium]